MGMTHLNFIKIKLREKITVLYNQSFLLHDVFSRSTRY